jgi:hypothetical protein
MKIKCPVIEDLLPLYIDEVCSEESKMIVEEHLMECELCSNKFTVQKSEIIIDDNVIKENLKSKEPFKRIKKSQMIRLIIIFVTIPLLLLSFMEVRGDGIGFSALYGRHKVERFLSYVEKGQFASATRYIAFPGGRYEKMEKEDEAKKEWFTDMQELKNQGIEITSHRQNAIITDDGFTSGYVIVSVAYENKTYDFSLFISTNNGKVEPGNLSNNINNKSQEPTEVETMLIEKISNVISTYNPG